MKHRTHVGSGTIASFDNLRKNHYTYSCDFFESCFECVDNGLWFPPFPWEAFYGNDT
jgi:hypothetical protein